MGAADFGVAAVVDVAADVDVAAAVAVDDAAVADGGVVAGAQRPRDAVRAVRLQPTDDADDRKGHLLVHAHQVALY